MWTWLQNLFQRPSAIAAPATAPPATSPLVPNPPAAGWQRTFFSHKTVTVPANGTVLIAVTGSALLFTAATGAFTFQLDDREALPGQPFLSLEMLLGDFFGQIWLTDTSGAPNTIVFFTGNGGLALPK